MSTYQKVLGNVFAMKLVEGDKELVKKIAAYLVEEGASFSITMDYPYTIWLSTHAVGLLGTLDWKTL